MRMASRDNGTITSGTMIVQNVKNNQHAAMKQQKMIHKTRPVDIVTSLERVSVSVLRLDYPSVRLT